MGNVFLLLFAITLAVLYIAVRRAWLGTLVLGLGGTILNTLFVTLYALLAQKTSTAQAIFAGLVAGVGFSVTATIAALFFRTNQPTTTVRLASGAQEPSPRAAKEGKAVGTKDHRR